MVMESFEDSNCPSMSDSFSMYERYMKSFNVRENFYNQDSASTSSISRASSAGENIDLSVVVPRHGLTADAVGDSQIYDVEKYSDSKDKSSFLVTSSHTDKSDLADAPVSDECFGIKPVFISSVMENSNNAVDSVPLFEVRNENVFKLPITQLSFNGTLKHMQKLKPIVDPIAALSTCLNYDAESKSREGKCDLPPVATEKSNDSKRSRQTESSADSQSEDNIQKDTDLDGNAKWNEQSYSSLEASFDSVARSPDVFSDGEYCEREPEREQYWAFLQDVQTYEKKKIKIIQETLQGVLPPPSVTTLKMDVTEMLTKYYYHLPKFSSAGNVDDSSRTPPRKASFGRICNLSHGTTEDGRMGTFGIETEKTNLEAETIKMSAGDLSKSESNRCSETAAKESGWPDVLKCRHHDVYYNWTGASEQYASSLQRYAERFVGAETDTSVNVHPGGRSPTSASKRRASRLKMAQAKSPGRRLSHLARRRQAFCSAATVGDKPAAPRMVLIDKNYFPHRKLTDCERGAKGRRTPGGTPGSGGSGRKRAVRRLLMDGAPDAPPPPPRRALFTSPEGAAAAPAPLRSRRSLFGSPAGAKRQREDDAEADRRKLAKSLSFGGASQQRPPELPRRASEMLSPRNSAVLNELHKKKLLWAVAEALRAHGWRMTTPGFREKASLLAKLTRRLLTLPQHAARLAAPKLSTSDTLFKLARQHVFAIIQGRTVDECFREEQLRAAKEPSRPSGYISAAAYRQLPAEEQPRSASASVPDEAKLRAKRQISFDSADFPKR